ncbi:TPA: hypothetical protein ACPY7B_003354 [Klebsiella pneumoniae]
MNIKARRLLAIAALLSFSSLQLHARELTDVEKKSVEQGVGKLLKDPYSAKYTHDSYEDTHGNKTYCGKVNAKNSYGAYIGDRMFAVVFIDTESEGLIAPALDMDNQEVVKSVCASAGYDIPVSKLFKDDVNKSRLEKGFSKLSNSYFY